MSVNQHAKKTTPNKLLLSILPFLNRFIFDKTRQNQRLDAKHYSVTAYDTSDFLAEGLLWKGTAESLDNAVVRCYHIVMIVQHEKKVVKMRSTMKQRSIKTDHRLATIGAKVDPVFHKKVKEFTFRNNMSIAYLLEMAIKEFIDRYGKES